MCTKLYKKALFVTFLTILFILFSKINLECKQISIENNTINKAVSISVKITHQPAAGSVSLMKLNLQTGEYSEAGKLKFTGNKTFVFQGDIREPNFYIINFFDKNEVELILSPGQNISMDIDLLSPTNFSINGSEDTKNMYIIDSKRRQMKDELINPVIKELIKAQKENHTDKIVQLTKSYHQNNETIKNDLKQQLKNVGTPVVVYSALKYFDMDEDINFLDSLSSSLMLNNSKLELVKYFADRVNKAKLLAIGAMSYNISLPNPEGDEISLYSLKGKYVLINFWASWSKQCREENFEYRKIYDKYKSKGFEIYSVSLDEDRQKWIEAVQEDLIHWLVVSDLKGFDSETAKLYNIAKIPQNYLVDKEGHIVAKNLKGINLDKTLAELFK